MVGPAAINSPDMNPPPAQVETYTQAQLEAIRGSVIQEGLVPRSDIQLEIALAAQGSQPQATQPESTTAVHPSAYYPFNQERQNALVEGQMQGAQPSPPSSYRLPPALQRFEDNRLAEQTDNLARDMYINQGRERAGIASFNVDNVRQLESFSPARAAEVAVKYVDNILWDIPRGSAAPGWDIAKTSEAFRMRDDYRNPPAGMTPEQIQQQRAEYENLCKDYMIGNLHGTHQALIRHAFEGFEIRETSDALWALTHPDPTQPPLTQEKRQEELVNITSNVPREHFATVMNDYAARPQREAGRQLHEAIQNKDLDSIRRMLAGRTSLECDTLMANAERYASENHLPAPHSMISQLPELEQRNEVANLLRGFSARTQAEDAFKGWDHTLASESEIRAAFGYQRMPDGKETSLFTADQIRQIREQLRQVARDRGEDPDEVENRCVELAAPAINNPCPAIEPIQANLHADLKAAGMNMDASISAISGGMTYGFQAQTDAIALHNTLDRLAANPNPADEEQVLRILRFGLDPARTTHLSPDIELRTMLQAHEAMYVNPERNLDQPLRRAVDKLSGDNRIQALQIIEQGFYADQHAEMISRDVGAITRIGDGARTRQELLDRIDQVDKELRKRSGKGLLETIDGSPLSEAEKQQLRLIAGIPRAVAIHDELEKANPDTAVLSAAINTPGIESYYAAIYRPVTPRDTGNLRMALERAAIDNKLSRDFVVQTELGLDGIAPDTVQRLAAELDPTNPTIGTKDSALRGLTPAQLATVENGFNFVEEGRAQQRGENPALLRDRIFNLMNAGKITEDQAVRAGMMLEAKDPWDIAGTIDKNPAQALSQLRNLSPVEIAQVRDAYRELYGLPLLQEAITDPAVSGSFANPGEYTEWLDRLGDTLYGPGVKDLVVRVDEGVSEIKKATTPEAREAGFQKLREALESAAGVGAMKNTREMYDCFFAEEGKTVIQSDIDGLARGGLITPEQHQYLNGPLGAR